ncbi:hypothetical protein [Paenisporosarcina antarctica]|uniref:Uncharacterized protein n=1 Tax=Paenisporosarcina antarctica TaxID=417367 RepID=A0A4P7A0P3_9BACL|nr:hypothetical protein [Paenisporosarcina antarctica]QBP41969.1 hypothetical protein E2636_12775 [Paenisporosarcina antarctica]
MKIKRIFLFFIGLCLFAISIPSSGIMLMEVIYRAEMVNKYNITELNGMFEGAPASYEFTGNIISTTHELKDEPPYLNDWDDLVYPADISIAVNGDIIEVLERYPVKLERDGLKQKGLNQYTHYLSYWLIENQKSGENFFAVTLQLNGADTKQIKDGIMDGFIPPDEIEYELLTVQEDGTVEKDFFTYQDKSKLQTQLITPLFAGPAGYYTDTLTGYPSAIFPLIYPWLTTLIGIILMLVYFPNKVVFNRRKPKSIN